MICCTRDARQCKILQRGSETDLSHCGFGIAHYLGLCILILDGCL